MDVSERARLARMVMDDVAENVSSREDPRSHARSCSRCRAGGRAKHQILADIRYLRRQLLIIGKEIERERP